ncbi:MAG: branched-chain-amino-acid aminotransferase 2 [Oligoflexia bacterium]|nr:MAG: branched-chain-amino-acid aminotransferase 2 [Oligoflexia bacterium]
MMSLQIQKTTHPKPLPKSSELGFGKHFTDHMLTIEFERGKGWFNPRIIPYSDFQLDPAASVLHYGQSLFEGMKAFRQQDGSVALFRPEFNWDRMSKGADRLCMECPPKEMFLDGIKTLVKIDERWVPKEKGCALYIRPTIIGTEGFLGVRPADRYLFFVILSPVGAYYAEGLNPVKIWVEEQYLRAAPGGLGWTKAAANYAASLKAAQEAKKKGFSQVLWLDHTRKYIEEVGTMNVFFVFKNEIVTPALDGTILEGGVRQTVIEILKAQGRPIVERNLSLEEVQTANSKGELIEAFGTGTAAVISPIGELTSSTWSLKLGNGKIGPLSQKLYDELTGIQYGLRPDTYHWLAKLM